MTGVYLSYFWGLLPLSIGLCEIFFFSYFFHYWIGSLKFFKNNKFSLNTTNNTSPILQFIFIWHTLSYIALKICYIYFSVSLNFFNVYLIIFNLYLFNLWGFIFFKNSTQVVSVVTLVIVTYYYTWCSDYITLLLLLETITTVYYFFFLQHTGGSSFTLIKYKNLISQYLWLSFFTLIFFVFNTILWVYVFGTIDFIELANFQSQPITCFLILLAFFWKLGLPIFHFFKLELYQFLNFNSLILFSTVSLLVNSLVFTYTLFILNITFSLSFTPTILILLFSLILLFQSIDKLSFFYFFAISSINTWVFFIIISLV